MLSDNDVVPVPDKPCHKRSSAETWNEESPTGFYYHTKWRRCACNNSITLSRKTFVDCLQNHHLLFLGDSNIRSWYWRIQRNMINAKVTTDGKYLKMAEQRDLNITMKWASHEIPYYSAEGKYLRKDIKCNAWHLDQIPQGKNSVVVIHYTYHVIRIMPKVFRAHVRSLKHGLKRLFERNSKAKVFIKGPHSSNTSSLIFLAVDYNRKVIEQILYEELRELHNKVVYLDGWDLTTGMENVDLHPKENTVNDMVDDFMGHLCGR